MRRSGWFLCACVIVGAVAHAVTSAQRAQQPPQQPTFRSAVTMVPVDVRVVDKSGKPITDLEEKDFTVLENGVRQQIGQFSKLELATGPAEPGAKVARRMSSFSLTQQKNRIFLLLLGRGRLQEPSKGVDSLIRFVRERLLPQDQVAVFAYDRATDFTTDHEAIAQLLERFRKLHEGVDLEIGLQINSGLAAVYGAREIPRSVQSRIDQIFGLTILSAPTPSGQAAGTKVDQTVKEVTGKVQEREIEKTAAKLDALAAGGNVAGTGVAVRDTTFSEIEVMDAGLFTDLSLNDFMEVTGRSLQDLGNIYAGIEYLRHLDGEKHLVYVSEKGMNLLTQDEDELLCATANDARVVLDTFQTGGVWEVQTGGVPISSWTSAFANKTMHTLADMTGGVASVMQSGAVAMDRLDTATRSGYLIGYYPTSAQWNGKYRTISVKVNRPDAIVLYRHGYYAREEVGPFDRRSFITRDRLKSAMTFRREINDIKVKMDVSMAKAEDSHVITVTAMINPTRLSLKTVEGERVTDLDIAIVAFDEQGNMMGNSYQRAAVKLSEEAYQRARKDGIPYRVRFPANAGARRVRIVVYDFKADLVGSVDGRVL